VLRPRTNHSSATLNGEIYVIGDINVRHYDPFSNCWTLTGPALKYVTNLTTTSCEGKLYLIGSCAVKYNALTMQYFSSSTDSWCIICSPFVPKYLSSPCSGSMDGVIYLVADNTKKVYLYNPEGNMWEKVMLPSLAMDLQGLLLHLPGHFPVD
uniref:Uncharacterized protein n=2 Tax=Cyprinus carpio TaxID=7962 RepID=A0A9J8C013_CYPCA